MSQIKKWDRAITLSHLVLNTSTNQIYIIYAVAPSPPPLAPE